MKTGTLVLILAAALLTGCDAKGGGPGGSLTVAMMPKSKGNAYFIACRKGAEEAARELGVKLIWDGPTDPDPAGQNNIVDGWITRGVDVLAVAVENREGMSSVLKKARAKGIRVLTSSSTRRRPTASPGPWSTTRPASWAAGGSTRSSPRRSPPATWSSGRRRSRSTMARSIRT